MTAMTAAMTTRFGAARAATCARVQPWSGHVKMCRFGCQSASRFCGNLLEWAANARLNRSSNGAFHDGRFAQDNFFAFFIWQHFDSHFGT